MRGNNSDNKTPDQNKKTSSLWEIVKFTIVALAIVIPIRVFVAQPFVVSGNSMHPTFEDKDYLIINEITYRFNDPQRGDVVVFRYPNDTSRFFIKRIIGLPGETIEIDKTDITIINDENPDGLLWDEPYVGDMRSGTHSVVLGEGEYFVMGDNRGESSDSRSWGPLQKDFIIGKTFMRLLPIKEMSVHPGDLKKFESDDDEVIE